MTSQGKKIAPLVQKNHQIGKNYMKFQNKGKVELTIRKEKVKETMLFKIQT